MELDWHKHKNPSGEVVKVKTYRRHCPLWDNESLESLRIRRQALADFLQIPLNDLMATLDVTVKISRYPRQEKRLKGGKVDG